MAGIPQRWRKPLQYSVTIALMVALAATVDWPDVVRLLRRATPDLLVLLIAVYVMDRVFMAWKWHLLARTMGTAPSFWMSTRIYVGSSVAGIALPLGGLGPDVVRTMLLTREGMPSEHAVSSILVERLCGIAGAALMLLFAGVLLLVLLPGEHEALRELLPTLLALGAGGALLGVFALYLGYRFGALRRLLAALEHKPTLHKYLGAVAHFSGRRSLLAANIALSWLEQWAPILALYLAFHTFGIELGLLECAAVVPLASVLERLPISVAGFGVREAGIVLAAGWFGVSSGDAFLVSLFEHAVYYASLLPMALIYLVGGRGKVIREVAAEAAAGGGAKSDAAGTDGAG